MKQENQKPGQEQGGYQSNFAQDKEFMDGPKDDRPGGFGEGAGNFKDSDPTATEGSF